MQVVHLVTWPPNSRVSFYNGRGERLWQASAYKYDLAENLMFGWDKAASSNPLWLLYEEQTLDQME
jgi:hypothetical protein